MPEENTHGLTTEQIAEITILMDGILALRHSIETRLPRHRSLSLAVTNLEQARHWLADRLAIAKQ